MKQQNLNNNTPLQEEKNKKRSIFLLLLVLLLILALFTSVMVGFLIGRNTDPYRGQIIDTIVLGPDQNRALHVSGQVLYTDGSPYANGRVEMRSEPRVTTTDSRGRFFYESAEPGTHTLSVLDESGKALADCEFTISRNTEGQPINIKKQADGKYAVELSVNVRFIELAVELDAGGNSLKLVPEKSTALEDDGTLVMGKKTLNVEDGAVVLPSGTVVLSDKTVIVPENLILPDNNVTPIPQEGYTSTNGEKVEGDGKVTLADGTEIIRGEVKKPDGTIVRPEEPYQIHSSIKSDDSKSEENNNSSSSNSAATRPQNSGTQQSGETQPAGPSGPEGNPGGDNPVSTPPEPTDPSKPVNPPGPSEPEDQGMLTAEGENAGGWMVWKSQSSIDLFYNRTGGPAEKIQPGSSGFYRFRLKNTRSKELQITVTLSEDRLHIPLKFTLTPLDAQGHKSGKGVAGSVVNGTLVLESSIGAKTESDYQLDWEWPLEGSDKADTSAGLDGGDYIMSIQILAKERA